MRKEIKKLWIEALDSGDYPKTTGRLKDEEGYCCLGVLCELYRKRRHRGKWVQGFTGPDFVVEPYTYGHVLPPPVARWAGLEEGNPEVNEGGSLASINDRSPTFEPVIEVIKENL